MKLKTKNKKDETKKDKSIFELKENEDGTFTATLKEHHEQNRFSSWERALEWVAKQIISLLKITWKIVYAAVIGAIAIYFTNILLTSGDRGYNKSSSNEGGIHLHNY